MAATKPKLDSGIDPEKKQLAEVTGQQDTEVLGIGMTYVVGADWSVIVPRDWLIAQIEDIGLPEMLVPSKPRASTAYNRTASLLDDNILDEYRVDLDRLDSGATEAHRVTVELREGGGSRTHHVRASVFRDEAETGTEDGEWRTHDLGRMRYDATGKTIEVDPRVTEVDPLYGVWQSVANEARSTFDRMTRSHIASDIRQMIYDVVKRHTEHTIKLQRTTYLFPPGMAGLIDDLAELFSRIDDIHKRNGDPIAIRTFELLDTEDKREWVEVRVRQRLEESIDDIVDKAFDRLDGGETAATVVRDIRSELNDGVAETAELYNALLDAEISLEEQLERQKQQVADEAATEVIDDVLGQSDLTNYE